MELLVGVATFALVLASACIIQKWAWWLMLDPARTHATSTSTLTHPTTACRYQREGTHPVAPSATPWQLMGPSSPHTGCIQPAAGAVCTSATLLEKSLRCCSPATVQILPMIVPALFTRSNGRRHGLTGQRTQVSGGVRTSRRPRRCSPSPSMALLGRMFALLSAFLCAVPTTLVGPHGSALRKLCFCKPWLHKQAWGLRCTLQRMPASLLHTHQLGATLSAAAAKAQDMACRACCALPPWSLEWCSGLLLMRICSAHAAGWPPPAGEYMFHSTVLGPPCITVRPAPDPSQLCCGRVASSLVAPAASMQAGAARRRRTWCRHVWSHGAGTGVEHASTCCPQARCLIGARQPRAQASCLFKGNSSSICVAECRRCRSDVLLDGSAHSLAGRTWRQHCSCQASRRCSHHHRRAGCLGRIGVRLAVRHKLTVRLMAAGPLRACK